MIQKSVYLSLNLESMDDDEIANILSGKRKTIPKSTEPDAKKAKIVEIVENEEGEKSIEKKDERKMTKKERKAAKKAIKEQEATPSSSPKDEPKDDEPATKKTDANKRTLPSGLVIEDKVVGTGPVAQKGTKLGMRYIGKLMVRFFINL